MFPSRPVSLAVSQPTGGSPFWVALSKLNTQSPKLKKKYSSARVHTKHMQVLDSSLGYHKSLSHNTPRDVTEKRLREEKKRLVLVGYSSIYSLNETDFLLGQSRRREARCEEPLAFIRVKRKDRFRELSAGWASETPLLEGALPVPLRRAQVRQVENFAHER